MTDGKDMPLVQIRVRYSEDGPDGHVLQFPCAGVVRGPRTELLRRTGVPYTEMEQRGVMLPLVESHVKYLSRAKYDDLLDLSAAAAMEGKARVRFEIKIANAATGQSVAEGYTIHAVVDPSGKPIRPPEWFMDLIPALPQTLSQKPLADCSE